MRPNREAGTSLIEMMIALFVLAVGMLGVVSMQIKSMQFNQSAYYYAQAVYLANDILESIRSNPQMRDSYMLELTDTPAAAVDCGAATALCTPAQMRDWNLASWRERVAAQLVSGNSAIETAGDFVTVTVQFDDSRSEMTQGEPILAEYTLVTEI